MNIGGISMMNTQVNQMSQASGQGGQASFGLQLGGSESGGQSGLLTGLAGGNQSTTQTSLAERLAERNKSGSQGLAGTYQFNKQILGGAYDPGKLLISKLV